MSEIITVGLDLAKNVFQVYAADGAGQPVLRKSWRRDWVLAFFSGLQPCVVAVEACGGAHFWGREIGKFGLDVRLIPPAYVKPFVKRQKNDAADAEATGLTPPSIQQAANSGWGHYEDGRAVPQTVADYWRQQRHHQASRPCRGPAWHLAGWNAVTQASHAGEGARTGKQDGADRLRPNGRRWRMPVSGHSGMSQP